jgi:hypothetical protein
VAFKQPERRDEPAPPAFRARQQAAPLHAPATTTPPPRASRPASFDDVVVARRVPGPWPPLALRDRTPASEPIDTAVANRPLEAEAMTSPASRVHEQRPFAAAEELRWPELPTEPAYNDDTAAAVREWEHLARLDDEQRGR